MEATRDDVAEQNALCPPNPYPDSAGDWIPSLITTMQATNAWLAQPDVNEWLERSRLNLARGAFDHVGDPRMQEVFQRYAEHLGPGVAKLERFLDRPG